MRLACLLGLLLAPAAAAAQDRFEIQVYEAEINDPKQLGLQLHVNYTSLGHHAPEYPGETPPSGAARFTLEPALGVTRFLEIGAYVQAMATPGYGFQYAGVKLRTFWVVPRRLTGHWDLGLNLEVSYVPKAAEPETWGTEIRPVIGWRSKWIGLWLNPIIGWSLTGSDKLKPELAPAARVSVNTQRGFALGVEYYAGLGAFADLLPARQQSHLLFAAVDLAPPEGAAASPWSVNFGIGCGLTDATPQRFVLKAIVGRAF